MIIQIQPWINELELEELTKVITSTFITENSMTKEFESMTLNLTGAKCAHKVKFLIVNTADDAENATEIDFKTTGSAAFPIIIASKLDIPVFNIHKRDRIKELGEFINNL